MATTYQEYTGNASTTTFSYPFPVLKTEDIKVALNGVTQTTGYTATTSPAQVEFDTAPGDGVKVRVYRDTDVDSAKGVYAAGSSIRAADLNNNQDQVLYALQEEQNQRDWSGSKTVEKQLKIKSTAGVVADGGTYTINGGHITIGNDDTNALQLFHDSLGNGSFISEVGPGDLSIVTNGTNLFLQKDATAGHAEDMIVCIANGPVKLFHNNVQKLITESTGVDITGTVKADGATIDGNSTLNGNLVVTGTISDSGGNLELSDDVNISGHLRFPDDKKIYLGNGDDASIDWDTDGWTDRLEIKSAGDTYYYVGSGDAHAFFVDSALPFKVDGNEVDVRVDVKPYPSNAVDLGKSDRQFKDLYIDGTGYIDTVSADDITGASIVTSGTSTSDTKIYSAKRAGEIFYEKSTVDDITSGDTWVGDDNKLATTAAIDARIIDLVDDVGGFVPIANETSFPNANPDVNNGTGTIVSIGSLASNLTSNGSGVISISNGTVGNSTVTINGAANSTTYSAGYGMLVETTSTLNTYTFHRLSSKATEVTTVAENIANVNTVAGNNSNITTVAGISGNVTTVAGVSANVTTVAGVSANVTTVAGISSNVTTVAGDTTAINNITTNLSAVQGAATNATNAASSATAAASSATSAATSATTATTQATTATTQASTATTQATNAATSASTASTQATNAGNSATTATTQASNASTSATNALAYKNLALTYRNDSNGILTQVESAPYNLADSASTHTAWGNITDTGANAVFANETSNTLLTMSEGSSSYNYGSIT